MDKVKPDTGNITGPRVTQARQGISIYKETPAKQW
jgi:hypothetical protein